VQDFAMCSGQPAADADASHIPTPPPSQATPSSSQTAPMKLMGSSAGISVSKSRKLRSRDKTSLASSQAAPSQTGTRRSSRHSQRAREGPISQADGQSADEASQRTSGNPPANKPKKKKRAVKEKQQEDITVLRCGLHCMEWIVTNDIDAGFWVCTACRKLPAQVSSVLDELRSVRKDLHSM
jgi:hypothetical protein